MEKPLVSVIINTYNHKDYISQAIDSVLMQKTTFPFEIIIGEDESNDGTREICIDYAKKYPNKIRLFLRSRKDVIYINGGPTARYNITENLKASIGKYIALLPGDDYWTDSNKLQTQYDFLEKNSNCFLICHVLPAAKKSKEGWYDFDKLFKYSYLPHASNYMFRKFDLEKYREPFLNFPGGEVCILYIAASEGLIYHSSKQVSEYRYNKNGIHLSKSKNQRILGELAQLKMIKKYFKVDIDIYYNKRLILYELANSMNSKYTINILYYKGLISLRTKYTRIRTRLYAMAKKLIKPLINLYANHSL